jgi:hypothetical protein
MGLRGHSGRVVDDGRCPLAQWREQRIGWLKGKKLMGRVVHDFPAYFSAINNLKPLIKSQFLALLSAEP